MMVAKVQSSSGDKQYTIRKVGEQLVCDCLDHLYRSEGEPYICRHIADLVTDMVQFTMTANKSKAAEEIISKA